MKIAVIADIHGNMPALEAVLADLESQKVDEVLVGGDLVGRGPQGSHVVRRISDLGWPVIRGNHEEYLLEFRRGRVPDDWLETDEWAASRWMATELSDDDEAFIDRLPFSLTSQKDPAIRLVHGTPRSTNEGIGPWSSSEELSAHLESIEEQVLVCAHTHRPLEHRSDFGLIVNVGSVGLPFNGDQRAQYVIFHRTGELLDVEFRRVQYDMEQIFEIYETTGFLAEGGVTAQLLRLELEHAGPFLVPFLQWAQARDVTPTLAAIDSFRQFYDPQESMRSFLRRLQEPA